MSDFLKFWLTKALVESGIIVNREVEIRNWRPSGIGERTDLLVQAKAATRTAEQAIVSVVIEVKGCWNVNPEDMDRQLKREYLDGRERTHGIFLVGWFGQEHAKPKSMTFSGLTDSLHRRALELCDDDHTIRALATDLTIGKKHEPGAH